MIELLHTNPYFIRFIFEIINLPIYNELLPF